MLRLIPYNPSWMTHETLDVHAVYRRPVRTGKGEIQRDAHGFVQWDLTTPLPVRHHHKWLAKGFQYITLATVEDVVSVSDPELAAYGVEPLADGQSYLRQTPASKGPWDASAYLADSAEATAARAAALEQRIATIGPDAAEEFEQQKDPLYRLPERLRQTTPAVEAPEAPPPPRRRGRPRKEPVAA